MAVGTYVAVVDEGRSDGEGWAAKVILSLWNMVNWPEGLGACTETVVMG